MWLRVIALITVLQFSLAAFSVKAQGPEDELPLELELNQDNYLGLDNIFENLEVAANLGRSLVVVNKDGEIPILMPIRVTEKTIISSPSKVKGVNLRKKDIVDLSIAEVNEGFYVAEKIWLKERPITSLDQLAAEVKSKNKNKKAEERFFSLLPQGASGFIAKVIVDTYHQNAYGYGPDNEIWFISRCVTGRLGWATPRGKHRLKTKERDRYLDGRQYGETYHLWVSYWMPFYGGAGLHDAAWRETFWVNQRIYGSHGCVNLPLESAKFIYDHSKVGMPVVIL